ncbi:MAG: MFS transporter, partial [Chloroflexi bacterium]|nr:MFS transporter [Chloroflexota bacterium]
MLTKRLGLPHIQGAGSFITALFIDALGSGLFWPFSLLYFHVIANLPLSVIGLVLAIATLISLPMTPVTGILVDRVGTQRIIVASQLLEVVGFLGYLFVRTVPVLLITALLVAIGIRMFWVAFPTLIAEISPEGERDRWYGFISAAQNAGLGMGGLLAGVLIALGGNLGYQVLVAVNALSFLVSAALLSRLRGIDRRGTQQRQITETVGYRAILQDRPFLGIVVCNTAFILCISTATSALPVYLIEALHMPAWIVGIAFT